VITVKPLESFSTFTLSIIFSFIFFFNSINKAHQNQGDIVKRKTNLKKVVDFFANIVYKFKH
ncbi:MAG: hypothetical protein K2M23_00950, partial [Alphaproteobacteria bacterium]|nr:hypothetical protein [Alphaproteobacteria bacterium]